MPAPSRGALAYSPKSIISRVGFLARSVVLHSLTFFAYQTTSDLTSTTGASRASGVRKDSSAPMTALVMRKTTANNVPTNLTNSLTEAETFCWCIRYCLKEESFVTYVNLGRMQIISDSTPALDLRSCVYTGPVNTGIR